MFRKSQVIVKICVELARREIEVQKKVCKIDMIPRAPDRGVEIEGDYQRRDRQTPTVGSNDKRRIVGSVGRIVHEQVTRSRIHPKYFRVILCAISCVSFKIACSTSQLAAMRRNEMRTERTRLISESLTAELSVAGKAAEALAGAFVMSQVV